MRLFTQDIETLRKLYIFNLKKALDMEKKIASSLTNLGERSTDDELSKTFLTHLDETRGHVIKIEDLLRKIIGHTASETSSSTDGLVTEASDTTGDVTDASIRDIALIGVAQQIEHHEIAVYGTLRRWASLLELGHDVGILESIEAEEANADEVLSEIAQRVNLKAAA